MGLLVALVLLVSRQAEWRGWRDGAIELVARADRDSWLHRKMRGGWAGFTIGWCIFLSSAEKDHLLTHFHERQHIYQQFILGPLFYPLYILSSLLIFLCCPTLNAYSANPFELDAKLATEENPNLAPQLRTTDRWPWW